MCNDCHSSHEIARTDAEGFKLQIVNSCGDCHDDVTETYFETYHGKVFALGYTETASCHDCHGQHNILPAGQSGLDPVARQHRGHLRPVPSRAPTGSSRAT